MTARFRGRARGVGVADVRRLLLGLEGVTQGTSYGMPAFLLNGRFLARFRDDDTVLVLQLATIMDRDILMQMEPRAFFFTEHYRDYPAVLIRLAEVPRPLLTTVVTDSWHDVSTLPPRRPRPKSLRARRGR
jgi:hypothetical protein